jgi:hypothetical protein
VIHAHALGGEPIAKVPIITGDGKRGLGIAAAESQRIAHLARFGAADDRDRRRRSLHCHTHFALTLLSQIIDQVNASSNIDVTVSLNPAGNGLLATDSSGGSGNLIIDGDGMINDRFEGFATVYELEAALFKVLPRS